MEMGNNRSRAPTISPMKIRILLSQKKIRQNECEQSFTNFSSTFWYFGFEQFRQKLKKSDQKSLVTFPGLNFDYDHST